MELDATTIIRDFVDYLMPELKPHETAVYIFLLRKSWLESGVSQVRIGQRSMAPQYGRGKEGAAPSRNQLIKQQKALAKKGCIEIGDTNRQGTLFKVYLPNEIPLVLAKLAKPQITVEEDYFTNPERRKEIFSQDQWKCGYCGESVNEANATLDHIVPQSKGGTHSRSNLQTACLMCNSIKSGKTEDEVAMQLLKSIRARQATRSANDL